MRQKLNRGSLWICIVMLVSLMPSANAAKIQDFIPQESAFYLQVRDLDEVYAELELSENWKKVQTLLPTVAPRSATRLHNGHNAVWHELARAHRDCRLSHRPRNLAKRSVGNANRAPRPFRREYRRTPTTHQNPRRDDRHESREVDSGSREYTGRSATAR